jgi:hypothetical protein
MYLYKKSQKFLIQIAFYRTCPKIKKSLHAIHYYHIL